MISHHFKGDGKTGSLFFWYWEQQFGSNAALPGSSPMKKEVKTSCLAEEKADTGSYNSNLFSYSFFPLFPFAVTVGDTRSEELYSSPLLINMRNLMHGKMGLDDSLTLSHLENQTQICQRRMLWICWWNISHTEHITTLVKRLSICLLQVILSSSPHWIASKSSIIRLWPHHKDNMEQMIWHVRIWQHLKPPALLLAVGQHWLTVSTLASPTHSTSISALIATGLH